MQFEHLPQEFATAVVFQSRPLAPTYYPSLITAGGTLLDNNPRGCQKDDPFRNVPQPSILPYFYTEHDLLITNWRTDKISRYCELELPSCALAAVVQARVAEIRIPAIVGKSISSPIERQNIRAAQSRPLPRSTFQATTRYSYARRIAETHALSYIAVGRFDKAASK